MGVLELAIIALLISLVAGALGFTGVSKGFGKAAKVLFIIFLVLAGLLFLLLLLGVTIVL